MASSVSIKFENENRDTKNKVRFAEVDTEHVGTLYVSKKTYKELGEPAGLQVTIRSQGGEDSG